ncbi:MAG: DUF6950 family protein [Pseudorhodobacter sp.]
MRRYPDWMARLSLWLSQVQDLAFDPGSHDCGLFGAGAVRAQTGVDLAATWRGRYRTLAGGLRILRREGYADHIDVAARHLEEIVPARARTGDLAVAMSPQGPALTVVQGPAFLYAPGRDGLHLVDRGEAARAFRVG